MDNTKFLLERIDNLKPEEKEKITKHMLGVAAETARSRRDEIQLGYLPDYYDAIKAQYANWGKLSGLRTGNWVLDRMTMGLAPGEVTVIGGATSNGKTAVALNIAADVAMQGRTVLFVTLEMTHEEVGVRLMKIMGDKFDQYMGNIFLQKNDELNWRSVDGLMRKAKEEAGVSLVVIDHLHYFTRELQNTAEDLGNITKEFKKNAIRHKLPVILISHTRKASDSNTTKTGINDLRGSSYIAQDADIVLMVYRNRDFPDDIFVSLEKNRNRFGCPVGTGYQFEFRELRVVEPAPNPRFFS